MQNSFLTRWATGMAEAVETASGRSDTSGNQIEDGRALDVSDKSGGSGGARLGSLARPRPVSGTRMPSDCPWRPNCDGHLIAHGHNLHLCSTCETWFEFLFDAGDTAEWTM